MMQGRLIRALEKIASTTMDDDFDNESELISHLQGVAYDAIDNHKKDKMKKSIEINYGLMADSLTKQIKRQGFVPDPDFANLIDRMNDCIGLLAVHSILSITERYRVILRLHKFIVKELSKPQKLRDGL